MNLGWGIIGLSLLIIAIHLSMIFVEQYHLIKSCIALVKRMISDNKNDDVKK